ncbi:uncharacterized protein BDZ99DRAFT_522786 [Mytilinidion resinicola]|uniref:Velvet domain-containing protein n=1 Tax=Mytilinidion resinicola TaxID=574789 RepID=A0A6A6YF05_9PEZI|nr:uncharacterized protein BDZ99DRAFT_522786 [Mytilinidion resinicola]KAF2807158.1 hypothetical protein BDZ99DRAFT_522786 [Mytilinidion resinicola]
MADVARRTQTAVRSRAVNPDFSRERSRPRPRRTRTNDDVEPRNQRYREPANHHPPPHQSSPQISTTIDGEARYAMDVIVQPPPTARLGTALQPPVTIRLRSLNPDTTDDLDPTNLLAVATLTSDSINDSTDPVDLTALLSGRVFDSIHPFAEDDTDSQGVGYVSFPDLAICGEGTWRIRVTLIRIRSPTSEPSVSSRGGSSVQVVDSNPITVERGSGLGRESGEEAADMLQSLRRSRTRRRSPVP